MRHQLHFFVFSALVCGEQPTALATARDSWRRSPITLYALSLKIILWCSILSICVYKTMFHM